MAFRRKQGLQTDHCFRQVQALMARLALPIDTAPRKLERPSDHTP